MRCKSGHAFMKECMRLNDVVYGGEMSAHHYSVIFILRQRHAAVASGNGTDVLRRQKLSELVGERMENSRAVVKLTARLKTAKPYWPPLKKNMVTVKLTNWTGSALNMTTGALT